MIEVVRGVSVGRPRGESFSVAAMLLAGVLVFGAGCGGGGEDGGPDGGTSDAGQPGVDAVDENDGSTTPKTCSGDRFPACWTRLVGSPDRDAFVDLAYDGSGNIYASGRAGRGIHDQEAEGGIADGMIVKFDGSGQRQWSRVVGSSSYDSANGVAVDPSGRAYIAGKANRSLDAGSVGKSAAFVVAFGPDGNERWSEQFGETKRVSAQDVALGPDGNLYVVGITNTEIHDVDDGVGFLEAFIAKYRPSGSHQWTKLLNIDADRAFSVVAEASGLYIAGGTQGTFAEKAFVAKYDTSGNRQWVRTERSTNDKTLPAYGREVVVADSGSIYLVGDTEDTLDDQSFAGGRSDGFVIKYSSSGDKQWTRLIGTEEIDDAKGVAVRDSGTLLVAGAVGSALDAINSFGGADDGYVAAFDASGNRQWVRHVGGEGIDAALSVQVGPSGRASVAGDASLEFNNQSFEGGETDAFLIGSN